MADKPTLADVLMDLGALGRSLPERTEPPSFLHAEAGWNPTRAAIERPFREFQYGFMYPPRAAQRYFTEQRKAEGKPVQWPDGGVAPVLYNQLQGLVSGPMSAPLDYTPGPRESDMVEDRRGPWWQYK